MPELITSINCAGHLLSFDHPRIMAILNISPESFYDGGAASVGEDDLRRRVGSMLADGAHVIDIGGASSKPGIAETDPTTELRRVTGALEVLAKAFPAAIFSVDTYRASVAKAALDSGACIVNDISGGTHDPEMWPLLGERRVPFVAMHRSAPSAIMQEQTNYEGGVVETIYAFFSEVLAKARTYGVDDVVLDPGFGFGKTTDDNYLLLARLRDFRFLRRPILAGVSRKSMLYKTIRATAEDALHASTAAHTLALTRGANLLRVHDVKPAADAIAIYLAFRERDPYGLPSVPLV